MNARLLFYMQNPENYRIWEEKVYCRHGWVCEFAGDRKTAREKLTQTTFDVVVLDNAVSEEEAMEFLQELTELHPETARFLLVGAVSPQSAVFYLTRAHLCLPQDVGLAVLEEAVDRAGSFKLHPPNPLLIQLISRMETIPSMPAIYLELINRAQQPDVEVEEIASIVEKDPGLSARMLRLVNSAYYGIARELNTPSEAIAYLGMNVVLSLALALKAFAQFEPRQLHGICFDKVWRHSLETAELARKIARHEKCSEHESNAAYMAGLLHDIGKLILAENFSSSYQEAVTLSFLESISLSEAETRVFGSNHAQVAGCLLGFWGLPIAILDAITHHHFPSNSPGSAWSPLAAVHLANGLVAELNKPGCEKSSLQLDWPYLDRIGITPRFDSLVQSLREDLPPPVS